MGRPRKNPVVELTLDEKIAAVKAEIDGLNDAIKGKKKELKVLNKKKAADELAAKAKKETEEKLKLFEALKNSEKSVEEILDFLK